MPTSLAQALNALVGHVVHIATVNGSFTGTLASVTNHLVTLSHNNGVAYICPDQIVAVSTAPAG